jgi:hypothetical protein
MRQEVLSPGKDRRKKLYQKTGGKVADIHG